MSQTKFVAVLFLFASAVVQASQCSHDGECRKDGKSQSGVSLLQTKLQTDVTEDVRKLVQVEMEEPDGVEAQVEMEWKPALPRVQVMPKASSLDRHLATIRPTQPIHMSNGNITLSFLSAVPTFGPEGNYIALLHRVSSGDEDRHGYGEMVNYHLGSDHSLWNALKDYEWFCSGPGKSHRVRMRLGGEISVDFPSMIWHCDWPQEEAHAGSYQVFFEEADGTEIGHLHTSYDPMLLKKYDNAACVTSVWSGTSEDSTKGVMELPQWLEYNLINGVDHFLVYTMTGTEDRVLDIYKPYLSAGVATRIHLEIPDQLSGEYQAVGTSTHVWLTNDCLYRLKNHAKWMSPTVDVDEYVRFTQNPQVQDGPRLSWDSIQSHWKDNTNNPNVHSLTFGRFQFLRARDKSAIQISSSMREEHLTRQCPKYVVKPALVNALAVHRPTSWVAGSVGLAVPHQLAVVNHYRVTDSLATPINDTALVRAAPAVYEAINGRFKSKWENVVTKLGAMQLMEFTVQKKEHEDVKLPRVKDRCFGIDFDNLAQIELNPFLSLVGS